MLRHLGTKRLETARLVLRPFRLEDAEAMFRNWAGDRESIRFLSWPMHASVETTRALVEEWSTQYNRPDIYQWAVEYGGEVVGDITAGIRSERDGCFELAYCIGRRFWNQGITTEAARTILDYLFREVGAHRVEARHDPENPASGRVMAHCGMAFEGVLRQIFLRKDGVYSDLRIYSILRGEWEARGNEIRFLSADSPERQEAVELAWAVFREFEAPDYPPEGTDEFRRFLDSGEVQELQVWGCYSNGTFAGMSALRGAGHICLLFVRREFHRRGIARRLMETVLAECRKNGAERVTVNASPYSAEAYRHMGFADTGPVAEKNGIQYIPMVYMLGRG